MVHRKKSSKLIPILFFILIIFLTVLVVNNYLTYQGLQAQEQRYQELQQALIDDAIAEEVVEEVEESPFSSRHYSAEDNIFLLLSAEDVELDPYLGTLSFNIIQYEELTGETDISLESGRIRLFSFDWSEEFNLGDSLYYSRFDVQPSSSYPKLLRGMDNSLSGSICIEGCDVVLDRSSKYDKIKNKVVIDISNNIREYVGLYSPRLIPGHTGGSTIESRLRNVRKVDPTQDEYLANNYGIRVYENIDDTSERFIFSEAVESSYISSGILQLCPSFEMSNENPKRDSSFILEIQIDTSADIYWSTYEQYNDDRSHVEIYPQHTIDYLPFFRFGNIMLGNIDPNTGNPTTTKYPLHCGYNQNIKDKYSPSWF